MSSKAAGQLDFRRSFARPKKSVRVYISVDRPDVIIRFPCEYGAQRTDIHYFFSAIHSSGPTVALRVTYHGGGASKQSYQGITL